jgi:hypothetical protein
MSFIEWRCCVQYSLWLKGWMYTDGDETLNVELGEQVGFGVTKWSSNLAIWNVVHARWLKL